MLTQTIEQINLKSKKSGMNKNEFSFTDPVGKRKEGKGLKKEARPYERHDQSPTLK